MELISSSAIKILANYGDSDEEEAMETVTTGTLLQQVQHGRSSPGLSGVEVKQTSAISGVPCDVGEAVDYGSLSPPFSDGRTPNAMEPPPLPKGSRFLTSPSPTSSPVLTTVIGRKRQGSSFMFSSTDVIEIAGSPDSEYIDTSETSYGVAKGEMSYDDNPLAPASPGGSDNIDLSSLAHLENLRPTYPCSGETERKFEELFRQKEAGFDFNRAIQNRTDFRNPSIYEKLVDHFGIDEVGTNFPKAMFDPHGFNKTDFYEEIARAQKEMLMKLEKANRDRDVKRPTVGASSRTVKS